MQTQKTVFLEWKTVFIILIDSIKLQYATSFQVRFAPVACQAGDCYTRFAVGVQNFVITHVDSNVSYVATIGTASA